MTSSSDETVERRDVASKIVRGELPPPPIAQLLGFKLTAVEPGDWTEASADQGTFFRSLGARVPREMFEEQKRLAHALGAQKV